MGLQPEPNVSDTQMNRHKQTGPPATAAGGKRPSKSTKIQKELIEHLRLNQAKMRPGAESERHGASLWSSVP